MQPVHFYYWHARKWLDHVNSVIDIIDCVTYSITTLLSMIGMKLGLENHELCQTPHMDALHLMGKHEVGLKIRAKYCSSSTESADTAGKLMCAFVCLELRINYTMGTSSELQALAVIKVRI